MPEGDTVYRTARRLNAALQDATITDVQTRVGQIRRLGPRRLVGQTVSGVESRGKHLLLWTQPADLALHTHLRMSGSWHLYRSGDPWRRPERQLTLRLDTADWVAVAFNVPVCEVLGRQQVERHPVISQLGPDAVASDTDLREARRRLDAQPLRPIGEALLDQRVLAGVGNVYKSEVLFLDGVNPWTPVGDVPPPTRDDLLATAAGLLKANAVSTSPRMTTGAGDVTTAGRGARAGLRRPRGAALWVYGRARRPCRRCGTAIQVRRQGEQARVTYWCPRCQPRH